jgi:biopolymer transport protein ExbB/TolQ
MVASSLVATLFGLLVTIIGWLGNKFYAKLDEISKNLVVMAGELHERINGLDRRVTRVETQYEDRRK